MTTLQAPRHSCTREIACFANHNLFPVKSTIGWQAESGTSSLMTSNVWKDLESHNWFQELLRWTQMWGSCSFRFLYFAGKQNDTASFGFHVRLACCGMGENICAGKDLGDTQTDTIIHSWQVTKTMLSVPKGVTEYRRATDRMLQIK